MKHYINTTINKTSIIFFYVWDEEPQLLSRSSDSTTWWTTEKSWLYSRQQRGSFLSLKIL